MGCNEFSSLWLFRNHRDGTDFPDRRECLLARIRRLPERQLPHVEDLLTRLECGNSSQLSSIRSAGSGGPQPGEGQSGDRVPHAKNWPHAPIHRISEHGTYIVTGATLHKERLFRGPERLDLLESTLLGLLKGANWQVAAWAAFSNHYHFVAHATPDAEDLRAVLKQLHGETAQELNLLDRLSGRSVWFNFWDTKLTFEKSYLARLNYVHQNAVKHRLAPVANQYAWCSAAWFERTATAAQVATIYSFKLDKVHVRDDYDA